MPGFRPQTPVRPTVVGLRMCLDVCDTASDSCVHSGILSSLSPCVLLLVPGYVPLISGTIVEELSIPGRRLTCTVMLHSLVGRNEVHPFSVLVEAALSGLWRGTSHQRGFRASAATFPETPCNDW